MGFDLYGLSPHNPTNAIRPEQLDWSKKHSDKERDEYFDAVDSYEKTVIGSYFRNNVWWWRPLWQFVTMICDDILTEKDVSEGGFNGGHKISKTKSKRIAARIRKADKEGVIDTFQSVHDERRAEATKVNKKIAVSKVKLKKKVKANGHGDIAPIEYPEPYRTEWEALQDSEQWAGHYPFDGDNVRQFGKFCDNSGGFEIC